ncbi:MAG TPA: hypothetical protein VGN01_12600 [Acidobacteriaceae bacterium]|jgi:hypothetical protein
MNPHRNRLRPRTPLAVRPLPAGAPSIAASSSWAGRKRFAQLALLAAAILSLAPTLSHAADKKAPPAKPAAEYAANDAHPNEHVTVAADPCDDAKLCPFFRLPYLAHGLLPIRVIFTNDSDQPLSLEDARMQFISANNDKIPAATTDEINRRIFTLHSTQPIHIPLDPFPIKRTPVDKKVTDDNNDFGFKSTVIHPHSSLDGYLFYDIKDLDEPALRHAELYVKMVHTLDGSQELFAFTIPLDKWLDANPDTPSNHPRH